MANDNIRLNEQYLARTLNPATLISYQEGAVVSMTLTLIDGKAQVIREELCDGAVRSTFI
jgi:hypothetical protein